MLGENIFLESGLKQFAGIKIDEHIKNGRESKKRYEEDTKWLVSLILSSIEVGLEWEKKYNSGGGIFYVCKSEAPALSRIRIEQNGPEIIISHKRDRHFLSTKSAEPLLLQLNASCDTMIIAAHKQAKKVFLAAYAYSPFSF